MSDALEAMVREVCGPFSPALAISGWLDAPGPQVPERKRFQLAGLPWIECRCGCEQEAADGRIYSSDSCLTRHKRAREADRLRAMAAKRSRDNERKRAARRAAREAM